jgi:hypothetical protein
MRIRIATDGWRRQTGLFNALYRSSLSSHAHICWYCDSGKIRYRTDVCMAAYAVLRRFHAPASVVMVATASIEQVRVRGRGA